MTQKTINELKKMIDVNIPIIYINDYDFIRMDEIIYETIGNRTAREWSPATGVVNFENKEKLEENMSLADFLRAEYDRNKTQERYIILKEIEDYIDQPDVKTLLMLLAQRKLYDQNFNTTFFIVSSVVNVPEAIRQFVSYLSIELPKDEEIKDLIEAHVKVNNDVEFDKREDINNLIPSLRGMTAFEIDRTLDMAMSKNGNLTASDRELINQQKKQMVKNSGLLELVNSKVGIKDIGGMGVLKKYLEKKAQVMDHITKAKADYGVKMPKGVFIVGMPGCGKSLSAKAAAAEFKAPLLKLDMGSMMGKYVGESEGNLRKAIKIAEAAAPCILWIDEVEKAFSGVGSDSSEVVTRMFGYLLGWLQDKESSVYVIATANNAEKLPPELKRKGRFDEIFCVNLPNKEEREEIFKVHLGRFEGKNKVNLKAKPEDLARLTEGFNGADIEAVVSETVEQAFLDKLDKKSDDSLTLTTEMFKKVAEDTVSISKSCKEQIEKMKNIFKESNFKSAT
jgi:ATP-dependent 26S proteasome regulatory subunit